VQRALGLTTWGGYTAVAPFWGCETACLHDTSEASALESRGSDGIWDPDHPYNYGDLDVDPQKNGAREVMLRVMEGQGYVGPGDEPVMLHEGSKNLQLTIDDCVTFLRKQNWAKVHDR
jgi:hypothetical protein